MNGMNALCHYDACDCWYGQVHRVPTWHVYQTRISIQATDSNRPSSCMLISSERSKCISFITSTVTVLNLSRFLLNPSVLTVSHEISSWFPLKSQTPVFYDAHLCWNMREQWQKGEHGEAVRQSHAVSFATERTGWLHRKTWIQNEKFPHRLFHIPLFEFLFCFPMCFFYLFFFFSMLWLNISCSGKSAKTDSICQVPYRVLTCITQVEYKRAGPVQKGYEKYNPGLTWYTNMYQVLTPSLLQYDESEPNFV